MSELEFVEAPLSERGEVAAYLVALVIEQGLHPRVIKKAKGGYLVPAGLFAGTAEDVIVEPIKVISEEAIQEIIDNAGREVNIETREDGGIYVKEDHAEIVLTSERVDVDREVIRAWAEENGYKPAKTGALKKAVEAAYYEANEA